MTSPMSASLVGSTTNKTYETQIAHLQSLPPAVGAIKAPSLKEPEWLTQQKAAEAAAAAAKNRANSGGSNARIVTYDVTTRGVISASISEFKTQANATLNDGRGWARMGIAFQEVASGGMFTLVLSEASQVPSFSSGCDAQYSCRVGRFVIINQDRWLGATPAWNNAGGSLRDYRHSVVNHETGHWLGHDHASCPGAGQPALVMQQQSISLQGCTFNPWPTASELWSTQLGIR
jgi:hypothetical protein